MELLPDLLSGDEIGKSPKSRMRLAFIAGSLELQDWERILNEAGNEAEVTERPAFRKRHDTQSNNRLRISSPNAVLIPGATMRMDCIILQ